jgi:hypothetical protein
VITQWPHNFRSFILLHQLFNTTGDILIIAKINCSTNKIEIIFKELRILDLFLTLKLLSRYGRIIRIEQNRIIIFGMINASLLKFGVAARVTITDE